MMYVFFLLCVFFVVGKFSLFLVGAAASVFSYVIGFLRDALTLCLVGFFCMVIFRMVF